MICKIYFLLNLSEDDSNGLDFFIKGFRVFQFTY